MKKTTILKKSLFCVLPLAAIATGCVIPYTVSASTSNNHQIVLNSNVYGAGENTGFVEETVIELVTAYPKYFLPNYDSTVESYMLDDNGFIEPA